MQSNPQNSDSDAFYGSSNNFSTKNCHKREDSYKKHCGQQGHTTDKCYKLQDFPPGFKFTIDTQCNCKPSYLGTDLKPRKPSVQQLGFTHEQCAHLLTFLKITTALRKNTKFIIWRIIMIIKENRSCQVAYNH